MENTAINLTFNTGEKMRVENVKVQAFPVDHWQFRKRNIKMCFASFLLKQLYSYIDMEKRSTYLHIYLWQQNPINNKTTLKFTGESLPCVAFK